MVKLTESNLFDQAVDQAIDMGQFLDKLELRAINASYDMRRDRIIVELINGCSFMFPSFLVQGLADASPDELRKITLLGDGYGLHWEALDVDLTVPGLLSGVFGTRAHMARLAGRVSTPAKAQAARANGAKGGRPRKVSAA